MKSYPNKSVAYVILNKRALKNWLILENFQFFFHWNFFIFRDIDYVETQKNAEHLDLEVRPEAAEIITQDN